MRLLTTDRIERLELFDGEDTRDLMHVIQESFGIEFTADELVAAETVGLLGECISNRLKHPRSDRCLSAVVFYQLRRSFVDLFGYSRSAIRPDTELIELLPWSDRNGQWRRLQGRLGLILPHLTLPFWLLCSIAMSSAAITWAYVRWLPYLKLQGMMTAFVWLLAFILLAQLSRPLSRAFPRGC